jgi:3-methyladenine DNA glycosylase/8-oxoguanine DNA glycosylase
MAGTHSKTAPLMPTAMLSNTTSAFMTGADAALTARAERWRPWRAYGALYWTMTKEMSHD